MVEAWVKREAERQKLLQQLMQKVFDVEEVLTSTNTEKSMGEEERIGFALDLIQVLAAYLKQSKFDECVSSFFFRGEILPSVEGFSRAKEENDWLLLELMGKLKESVGSYLHNKLAKLELSNPQRIFHAHSAMTEIPFNS